MQHTYEPLIIRQSFHLDLNLDGLNPRIMKDLVRVVGCRKTEATRDASTNYMLGPPKYHTHDSMVLIRPIAQNVTFKPIAGSHRVTKSEFDKSDPKSTAVDVRRIQVLEARTTLWMQWANLSESDELLFAVVVYANGPADKPDEGEDFPGHVEERDVAPFMVY